MKKEIITCDECGKEIKKHYIMLKDWKKHIERKFILIEYKYDSFTSSYSVQPKDKCIFCQIEDMKKIVCEYYEEDKK